jgi:hypothetical protein
MDWLNSLFDAGKNAIGTVVNWVTGSDGSAVSAITGGAVQGAIWGSLFGAAQAALNGGDVFKGALKGAAYGGAVGGIASSIGQMSGTASFSKEKQLENAGYSATSPIKNVVGNMGNGILANQDPKQTEQTTYGLPKTSFWKTDEGAKVLAGGIQGLASGAGNYLTAKEQSKSRKDELAYMAQVEKDKIAANMPGKSQAGIPRFSRVARTSWWEDKLKEA